MNSADFWASVRNIIAEGFTPEGLQKLDTYAAEFISGRLVYQRFSPHEQHGCAAGGHANVVASLLAGAEAGADSESPSALSDYERERQQGAKQEAAIERWAKAVGLWTADVEQSLPQTLGEQIAEQPFIDGQPVSDAEISEYMRQMGFELKNARNWTYATPDIYLSDMHDENVIRSNRTNTIFVVDCDIRINTPELRQGGQRSLTTEVRFE